MRRVIYAASMSLLLCCSSCHAQTTSREGKWQEDFSALDSEFVHRQIDPFGRLSRERWQADIARLRRLPLGAMSDAIIGAEIEHVLAEYHDGHIKILTDGSTAEPEYLPAKFRWFTSGIYITGAVDPKLRGARVLRLGAVGADALLERIAPWVSVENDSGLRAAASNSLWNAAILTSAGIADTTKPVPVVIQLLTGQVSTVLLTPEPNASIHWPPPNSIPEYRQVLTPPNWLKLISNHHAIYLRYAECRDKGRSEAIAKQVRDAMQDVPSRIIVDLRGNEGGDSGAFGPLLNMLKSRPDKSRLIVLVDRGTFSSAFRNAVELKQIGATLLGEAPSQRPVYTGNVETFLLPHSRLQIRYTTKWSRMGPAELHEVTPDVSIQPTAEEYLAGEDPVLAKALQVPL